MKKQLPYRPAPSGKKAARLPRKDPRVIALVKFLARRAAERDYEKLFAERPRDSSKDDKVRT